MAHLSSHGLTQPSLPLSACHSARARKGSSLSSAKKFAVLSGRSSPIDGEILSVLLIAVVAMRKPNRILPCCLWLHPPRGEMYQRPLTLLETRTKKNRFIDMNRADRGQLNIQHCDGGGGLVRTGHHPGILD